jgi:hypothetical protein
MLQNSEIYLLIPNRPSLFVQSGAKSVLPESLPILERSQIAGKLTSDFFGV